MAEPRHTVTLRPDPQSVDLISVRNPFGRERLRWTAVVRVSWDDKELSSLVTANTDTEDRSTEARARWGLSLCAGAAASLVCGSLSAFRENDVSHDLPDEPPDSASLPLSVTVSAADFDRLAQEQDYDRRARQGFNEAVRELRTGVGYGVSDDARTAFAHIRACVQAGYLGHSYSWYQEKLAGIGRSLDDLARRKDRRHAGYRQSLEYIEDQLYSFNAPEAWRERPPAPTNPDAE